MLFVQLYLVKISFDFFKKLCEHFNNCQLQVILLKDCMGMGRGDGDQMETERAGMVRQSACGPGAGSLLYEHQ